MTKKNSRNIYLHGKASSGVLRKKSQEKASETDEEERNDETLKTSESTETNETDSSEEEKSSRSRFR